jgi:Domain of unknown function (DUF3786)
MKRPPIVEQDNYEVALKLVRDKWKKLDPALQAKHCGAGFSMDGDTVVVTLPFFGQPIKATHPAGDLHNAATDKEPSIWEQILILHYLASDSPVLDSDKIIAFSEIPDGKFYHAAYQKRTRNYLLGVFGARMDTLKEAAVAAGAELEDKGDISFYLKAFPKVSVHFVCWRGDEEFEPEASVLWEESVQGFLDIESIAVLGGMAVGHLARISRELKG